MKRLAWRLALTAVAVAWGEPAVAQTYQIDGTIVAPKDASGVVSEIDSNWTQGGYVCKRGPSRPGGSPVAAGEIESPTLLVHPDPGTGLACDNLKLEVSLFFEVLTGGGQTTTDHPFVYFVTCVVSPPNPYTSISHSIAFDGGALQPINSGVFTFNLTGGDTIRITTAQYSRNVPALGPVGIVGAVGALVLGLIWFWRRTAG